MYFVDSGKNSGNGVEPVLEREETRARGRFKKTQSSLLVCLSVVVNSRTKSDLERSSYFFLSVCQFTVQLLGKLDRDQKAGIKVESMEKCCLLSYCLWLMLSQLFKYNLGPPSQE